MVFPSGLRTTTSETPGKGKLRSDIKSLRRDCLPEVKIPYNDLTWKGIRLPVKIINTVLRH